MPDVPRAVVESWDWTMRLDPDLLRDPTRGEGALAHLARQRLRHLAPFIRRVPSAAGADLAYFRYQREGKCVRAITPTAAEPPQHWPLEVDSRWLFCSEVPVLAGRRSAGHWGRRADLDPQWSMPHKQRELETRWRKSARPLPRTSARRSI